MTPPPPGMRYDLRRGFTYDGSLPNDPGAVVDQPPVRERDRHRAAAAGIIALGLYVVMMLVLTAYVMHAQWSTRPAPVAPVVTPSPYVPTGGPAR